MAAPAITLEVLPAGYGDCLFVTCPVGKRSWRMLIDTGPDEAYPGLRARLARIPPDGQGRRHIDLFVVTHIDHDHIGGAALLLGDEDLRLSFGDVWFNAPARAAPRGVAEGESLATILGAAARPLPWNLAFQGQSVVTSGEGATLPLARRRGAPRITLLSPTPDRLARLFKVWDRELAKLRAKEALRARPRAPAARERLDVEALAAKATATDRAVANLSSIALLLEHRGASVLLTGDAAPTVLAPALRSLAGERGLAGALKVDAFKLSHHGSRANVTLELLRAVQADHYAVSTNNAIFDHPDDEAIARVLVHGGASKTLWFNYATDRNRKWAAQDLADRYRYQCLYPGADAVGVSIGLPPRTARSPRAVTAAARVPSNRAG